MTTPYQIVSFKSHSRYLEGLEGWLAITTIYNTDIDVVDSIQTIGHIFMQRELDNKIKFMDAWVHPNHRRQGIYRALWETRWEYVSSTYPEYKVYAWCKESSLPLLIEKGFIESESSAYVERDVTLDQPSSGPRVPVTC